MLFLALLAAPAAADAPAVRGQSASAAFDRVAPAKASAAQGLESWTPPALAPVPEPAIWAMMIAGFGFAGSALRRKARPRRIAAKRQANPPAP